MFQKKLLAFKLIKDLSNILVNIDLLTINLLNGCTVVRDFKFGMS